MASADDTLTKYGLTREQLENALRFKRRLDADARRREREQQLGLESMLYEEKWAERDQKAALTHVYFIQAVVGGPIKIGFAKSPAKRLKQMQLGCPVQLQVCRRVRVHEDRVRDLEYALHTHFAAARLHGEWFKPTPELARLAHGVDIDEENLLF